MADVILLDLFCGAGGGAEGYRRAGFDVFGVDIKRQRHYPFGFVQADAMDVLAELAAGSWSLPWPMPDAIHASPPCQAYSSTRTLWNARGDHPDLLGPVRDLLRAIGLPWIIENVRGAPMAPQIILCGTMFGLVHEQWELRRHRWFETSGFYCLTPPCQHSSSRRVLGVYGDHAHDRRRVLGVYGNGGASTSAHNARGTTATIAQARAIMGIDWMSTREIAQAIPPAYTEFLGGALAGEIRAGAAA